ncbi:hypothetical protein GCM10023201_07030 [Actinomycetospora corticicola]|uniref:Lipoprotein n=1 Tax=Actinomycetospora corticicola TaxID=663602 RepID=A0A7Y9DU65_9PSEU|nr:hypothetical protein [Actinomycetospora corticicola]NYD35459.1 hypothetical protein [Actinomycetospora corticicola]
MRRLLPAVLLLVALTACAPDVERIEVVRAPSPDRTVDAVVMQSSAGSGSPFGYTLGFTAPGCAVSGEPVLRVVGATRSDSAAGVAVTWTGARTVRVSWLDARFRDPDVDSLVVATTGGPVTVVSGGGVGDVAAPPGGMPPVTGATRSC